MEYRIKKSYLVFDPKDLLSGEPAPFHMGYDAFIYSVQVKKWYGWVTIKDFCDILDEEFARLEAEELLELLNQ